MADDFGLKIGLEGEKEFKKALSEINQSFKVLGSEMKVVQSQFDKNDNSVEALTARNQVLNKEIEAQKQKIETLRQALANASESFGENDRRTQQWQIQLNNATAALNDMERELDRNNAALDDTEREMDDVANSADDLEEELDDAGDAADDSEGKFSKLGGTLKTVGVAMGACVAAAAAAAVSLGKAVVEAYSEYEQLVGGIDTLFKDSSASLQEYANNAYKTAGMSANDYMSTVTSFSAALISSLGGDTEAAVKYADMAITDMADNANKMGTDISMIQTAYQGFAKQNYTMLDNLKLGYGGTKTEMERLLADAQAISGIEYDISSYADVVEAIHVIQESMGIAGATAAEAEHTIEGSMNAMKAAIDNLIVGFGNADADIEQLCNNVVDAFQDVLTNITPVIENIISALPTALNALLATVGDLLPTLLDTVVDLFSQVLTTLLTMIPQLVPAVIEAVMTIVNTLIENLPLLVDAAVQIVVSLVEGIGSALPQLIPAAVEAIITIVQGLIDSLPMILDAALQLITGLADGLLAAIPVLIAALPEIILSIINFILDAIPQIIDAGIQLLTSLVSALPEIITAIVAAIPQIIEGIITAVLDSIPQLIQAGIDLLVALVQALPEIITTIVAAIPEIIGSVVNALINSIPQIVQAGVTLFISLIKNLPTIIVEIVKAVPQILAGLVSAFGKGVSQLAEVGGNLVRGLWQGIQSLASWLWNKVSGWISSIWDGICDFFGIASPSKEMGWVGEMLVEGLAGAINANGKDAVAAAEGMSSEINDVMHSLADDMTTALPTDFTVNGTVNRNDTASGIGGMGYGALITIQQMVVRSEEDIRKISQELYNLIQSGSRAQGHFTTAYGMAWAGSAPGPVSPRSWLEGVYDYAVRVMNPDKVFLGMPAYGWNWQIYDTPENLGEYYRGTSHTYYAAKYWMQGVYNFTDDAPPQPFIPIVSYWDDYDMGPWALPHVYDYMEGRDATAKSSPQMAEVYNRRNYLTAYSKQQKTEFGEIVIDHNAEPDSYGGVVSVSKTLVTLGEGGSATYKFTIEEDGVYDVAIRLCYPFWDKNGIYASLDGSTVHFSENRLWWPYWRTTFWATLAKGANLAAGEHTIKISVGVNGVQFYGFRVCTDFSEEPSAGDATYTLAPRKFKDINGEMVGPATGFKLTLEMLRRKPDSALVWYEDFRDEQKIPESYWTTLSGEWDVWQDPNSSANRPYSQLEGYGQLAWNYNSFSDVHLRAQIIIPEDGGGKSGIFLGSLFLCINYDTQRLELYEGSTLKGSYSASYAKTAKADLRTNPNVYTIEMRKRGNKVRVYSSTSYTLRFTATISSGGGYAGIRSEKPVNCQLLRLGDAWTYEPYERFDVIMPDGTETSYGRIARSDCTWDEEFQVFTLTSDVEEYSTRSEEISLDYEFYHSHMMPLECGNDYTAKIIPRDINIWISRLFLGDSDGFSILYYQDVDSLIYWANQAAYRWKLRGMCMWSLGQEDMRVWEWLPKQTE